MYFLLCEWINVTSRHIRGMAQVMVIRSWSYRHTAMTSLRFCARDVCLERTTRTSNHHITQPIRNWKAIVPRHKDITRRRDISPSDFTHFGAIYNQSLRILWRVTCVMTSQGTLRLIGSQHIIRVVWSTRTASVWKWERTCSSVKIKITYMVHFEFQWKFDFDIIFRSFRAVSYKGY